MKVAARSGSTPSPLAAAVEGMTGNPEPCRDGPESDGTAQWTVQMQLQLMDSRCVTTGVFQQSQDALVLPQLARPLWRLLVTARR
jgi:hypothetical protein